MTMVKDQLDFKPNDNMVGKVLVVTVTLSGSTAASVAAALATKRLRGSGRVEADPIVFASNTYHFGVAKQQQYGVLKEMLHAPKNTTLGLLLKPPRVVDKNRKSEENWPSVLVKNTANPGQGTALFVRLSLHHSKGSAPIPYVSFEDNYLTLFPTNQTTLFMKPMNRDTTLEAGGCVCASAWNADTVCKNITWF